MAHAIALTSTKKYFEPNERAYAAISPFFSVYLKIVYMNYHFQLKHWLINAY